MTTANIVLSPCNGQIVAILVSPKQWVDKGQPLLIVEAMKMQNTITAPDRGYIDSMSVAISDLVRAGQNLLEFSCHPDETIEETEDTPQTEQIDVLQQALEQRISKTLDGARQEQHQKRHHKGYNSARENLQKLSDAGTFVEYGQLAVAAQRKRRDYQTLQMDTAADGVITGIGKVNQGRIAGQDHDTALIINDYSVLAGTQGYFHHMKLDRMIRTIEKKQLPAIMFTEGGGGRPGDTDITTVVSGLQCTTFSRWAGLKGIVPRIAIANGYNFAGNAALFGAADIRIATESANIGMAGPAMIEGGGLGRFSPQQIGPVEQQAKNGVIDIVVKDEDHAIEMAKKCLGYFQGENLHYGAPDSDKLNDVLPADRRFVYDMHKVIHGIVDLDSFTEFKALYGQSVIVGLARLDGKSVGIMASNCKWLGGAIDVEAAAKLDEFMQICNQFGIAIISLCDTPGFMVGPEHEGQGAVNRLSQLFSTGAQLTVPFIAVVIRKCYGLGAQAMLAGSTLNPVCTLAWPNGEFGAMGLEGAVKLGFKQELDAQDTDEKRQALYEKLVSKAYHKGQAVEVASILEIDSVIMPCDTRNVLINLL